MIVLSRPPIICATSLTVILWLSVTIQRRRRNPKNLPLPPGPKGYPIIGNLLGLPTYKPWLVYDEWLKTYGDIVYYKVLGQSFLVLSSLQRTNDLFERRSSNYSDRPHFPMVIDLMGWDYTMGFLPYGTWWRRHRRTFHDHFHPNIVNKYQPIQLSTTRAFLRRLLDSPDDLVQHIRHAFASSILKVCYGIIIQEENDPYVALAEIALDGITEAGNPGSFLVDVFPIMKYVPSWFPGAGWKRKALHWRHINNLVANEPFSLVKRQTKEGTAMPSVATTLIAGLSDDPGLRHSEEIVARNTCAVAFLGGADTMFSTVQSFFMAMCLYPEVQKKAQIELDSVLRGRLPEFNDRKNLPYINAMIKESMRWQQVLPLAIGHMNTQADEYNGYYIPKGTIVLGNAWSILHDPGVFRDPLIYNPDRYLKDGKIDTAVRDPKVAFFGFGRRICPGRFFSENSLFAIISHVLAVYEIKQGLDKDATEVNIVPEMTSGFLSYPEPFKCRIVPRSGEAAELIRDAGLME